MNEFTSNNFIACFLVTSRNNILYNAFHDMYMKHALIIYANTINVCQHVAITSICCIDTLNLLAYIYRVKNLTWLNVHEFSQYFRSINCITFESHASSNRIYCNSKVQFNAFRYCSKYRVYFREVTSITKVSYVFEYTINRYSIADFFCQDRQ